MAMKPDADLTPYGIAATIASFLEAIDLEDVTIVGNDSGGAMSQVLVTRHPERIGRLVLTNCDTHENFPPGPFKALPPLAKLPGGMALSALPSGSGPSPAPPSSPSPRSRSRAELIRSWMEPGLNDPGVKRDLKKVTVGMNKRYTLEAAEKLRKSDLPVLLTWAPGDKVFPIKYAERLAGEVAERADRRDPRRGDLRPLRPARAGRRRDRGLRRRRLTAGRRPGYITFPFWGLFSLCACFSSDGGAMLHVPYVTPTPQRTESYAQGDLRPGPAPQRDGEKARRSVRGL